MSNFDIFNSVPVVSSYDTDEILTDAEFYIFNKWIKNKSKVLDLGVGTGRTYPYLNEKCSKYIGIDISPAMIEAARKRYPNGDFRVMDATDLSDFNDNEFDVVVFSFNGLDYLYPYENRLKSIHEIRRILKPGGRFIFSTHNARGIFKAFSKAVIQRNLLKQIAVNVYGTIRACKQLLLSKNFIKGYGYQIDRLKPLLTFYSTPKEIINEMQLCGLITSEITGVIHVQQICEYRSPWFYVTAIKPQNKITIERLSFNIIPTEIESAWDRITKNENISVFQTFSWYNSWIKFTDNKNLIHCIIAREDGTREIIGILPIIKQNRYLHRLLKLPISYFSIAGSGKGSADHLGPITNHMDVGYELIKYALESFNQTIYFESISPKWSSVLQLMPNASKMRTIKYYVNRRNATQSFQEKWSARVKKNIRRRSKQLEENGFKYRWIVDKHEFESALNTLVQLHKMRWSAKGKGGLFDNSRKLLINTFNHNSVGYDKPVLLLLSNENETIGALLGFRHNKTFSVYKTGWHPGYAKFGVGILLGAEAMRWAEKEGLLNFDYLRGLRGHKLDLGCREECDNSMLFAKGIKAYFLKFREKLS